MRSKLLALLLYAPALLPAAQEKAPPTFHTDFEAGSLGKVETLDEGRFRAHVVGQSDERGRNRQANWYFFRMDGVKGREITLLLTNFVGEYNDKPGACAMNADTIPVFSVDGERWEQFSAMQWNDQTKEATLTFRPKHDAIWIAHVPPYTTSRLQRFLAEVSGRPAARTEVIGRSVEGRPLHLITVTDGSVTEREKKTVWLIARQHAWETGTSFVMEGALRFILSDDAAAAALRRRVIFKMVPMMDPDGCAKGGVRFNANGYDVNRHWDKVNPRENQWAGRMPEIASVKRALFDWLEAGRSVDLMLNLHNTETAEYLQTQVDDPGVRRRMERFEERLVATTSFAPSRPLGVSAATDPTTNALWKERGVPVLLMEQRIGSSPELNRRLTVDDRLEFGRGLIVAMAESVLDGKVTP
jgi:hypothetical protein